MRIKDVVDHRIHPTDDILANDDALDLWIRQTVGTARHVSGTCKMGPDTDPMAVVDQYCRVKGVQGLWVVDASVMPRIPRSGGAHATVIMIGERVSRLDCGELTPPGVHGLWMIGRKGGDSHRRPIFPGCRRSAFGIS